MSSESFQVVLCGVRGLRPIESLRVIKFNTLARGFFSVLVCLLLSEAVFAQSVLNFSRTTLQDGQQASLSVVNPTSTYADVQFSLYAVDGSLVSSGVVNPVTYRIQPKGQIVRLASEIFAGANIAGWIQATSATNGLQGFYFAGDLQTRVDASEAVDALTRQLIPYLRNDQQHRTEVVIVNPNAVGASFTLTFFNAAGIEVGTTVQSLAAKAALKLQPAAAAVSARIDSSIPVTGSAVVTTPQSTMFIAGQSRDQRSTTRIVPHFASGNGFSPVLVLNNPENSTAFATVTTTNMTGGPVHRAFTAPSTIVVSIPAYGSVSIDPVGLTGIAFPPAFNGWLQIDSQNIALGGIVILEQADSMTAVPLERAPAARTIYPQVLENDSTYSGVALVNSGLEAANVDLFLVNDDGRTIAHRAINVPGRSKFVAVMQQLVPDLSSYSNGFVFMRSSRPIFTVGIRGAKDNAYLASVAGLEPTAAYVPDPIVAQPRMSRIEPGDEVRPGSLIRIAAENVIGPVTFTIGNRTIPGRALFPGSPTFELEMPNVEPGYVALRMRNNGMEAAPRILHVLPPDNAPLQILTGQAFYQKVEVTDAGLDLTRLSMVPVRSARVEVVDRSSQTVVSVSETDAAGRFRVPVPFEPDLTVHVVSRLRTTDLRVADAPATNAVYSMSAQVDARGPNPGVLIVDNTRVSGAFNILEVIQRGNDALRLADPNITAPAVTIFWNTSVASRSTYFSLTGNVAYVAGDRTADADEYDDSVILHEYAHLLSVRFSRDDSPGGVHGVGDRLDPRVAWSEGWANFFSAYVRNDAIYRDARAPGAGVLRYDLEENIPPGDQPGFWSEASVHSLLWDLYDDREDAADSVQFPVSLIWGAFTDLRNDRFVYLPYFLERFLARSPEAAGILREMVQFRSVDFQPNVRPSVTNPFPRIINVGEAVAGEVDSLTSRRSNLVNSSHFVTFTTGRGAATIRLDITGLGPGNNPAANDLDLFLMDENGRLIDRSDRGLNGQSEMISLRTLAAGTYVIEVRSFYTRAETSELVYNSGAYRLTVNIN